MEPAEIWALIVRADEALKYATEEKSRARRKQAQELLARALAEAEAAGEVALGEQARIRMRDLGVDQG